jgi:stalled ribosome rescue protein Dom34
MNNYVVWLSSNAADLFALTNSGIEKSHIEKKGTEAKTRETNVHQVDASPDHFHYNLAAQLKGANRVLVMGADRATDRFRAYLKSHHKDALESTLIGIKKTGYLSDKEIISASRPFFKEYPLFNSPIQLNS